MDLLTFATGLVVGVVLGAALSIVFLRKSVRDAERIAEDLSAKILHQQTGHILQLAETKLAGKKELIDGTLQHMKSELHRVEKLMQEIGSGNVKLDARLNDAAKAIAELRDTTGGLKNALSSNSGRGQWGERMAEDVLRLAGLLEGVNFIKQKKLESGSKPDFTFLLPNNLKLNMDVKFPFNNYQLYTQAKTDQEREEYKRKFLKDVRDRLKEIQTRDYVNPADGTVDYVLLFVPNEQIFGFINEMDRSLMDEALKARTILCSPLSLYAILSVIRQAIDTFSMERKSREMLSLFGVFMQQWQKFKEQMETVKARFESVHKGYEELTGVRERMLERPLMKIEEIRNEQGIAPEPTDASCEAVPPATMSKAHRSTLAAASSVER